jgi:RimJ/RimL family protein N-acetyltransferase
MKPSIIIRVANVNDAAQLFAWRNAPLVRQMSVNQAELSLQEHLTWLERALREKNRLILIGELPDGQKIGVVRFDLNFEKMESTISIIIDPAMQGKKLAAPLLQAGIEGFAHHYGKGINSITLTAQIRHENTPSIACFSRVGFVFEREDNTFKYLRFTL